MKSLIFLTKWDLKKILFSGWQALPHQLLSNCIFFNFFKCWRLSLYHKALQENILEIGFCERKIQVLVLQHQAQISPSVPELSRFPISVAVLFTDWREFVEPLLFLWMEYVDVLVLILLTFGRKWNVWISILTKHTHILHIYILWPQTLRNFPSTAFITLIIKVAGDTLILLW